MQLHLCRNDRDANFATGTSGKRSFHSADLYWTLIYHFVLACYQERLAHGWTYEEWEKVKTQDVMLGRVGTPTEIANAAVFFASDDSSYCTGTSLMVDGGAAACTVMQKSVEREG